MATYDRRLAGYVIDGLPESERLVEVLCKDHVGTYVLPFLCRHTDGSWISEAGRVIDVQVLGWREPKDHGRRRR